MVRSAPAAEEELEKRRDVFMRELWDVYTIDRRLTGKNCLRGKQGDLSKDAKLLATKVATRNDLSHKLWLCFGRDRR